VTAGRAGHAALDHVHLVLAAVRARHPRRAHRDRPRVGLQAQPLALDEAPCALCHKLAAANATGEIGPNLDELKPNEEKVRRAVERGVGNMPPFGEVLSKEQIDAVTKFVADAVR
jgi:mono/diheme cytochrome c family protein